MVGQVRQDRQVLRLGLGQLRRGQGQYATEHEEHHHGHHQQVGTAQDLPAAFVGVHAITALLINGKGRDDRRMVEREDHHRDRQPQGVQERRARWQFGSSAEDAAVPVRNQEHRQERQGDDERIDQPAHDLDRGLFATAHDGQQAEDQHKGQYRARWRLDVQLVLHEAADGVGQGHAIDQQDREDGKEIQQGDQGTGAEAEMLLDHVGDVGAVAPGEHEAGQAAVRVEGHRERQQRQDQQRPEAAEAGVDRQEQGPRANRRAKQAQHPGSVLTGPAAEGGGGRFEALFNAWGLLIHPGATPLARLQQG
ncbi:hypothetical protein D3C80_1164700 [compost metagenome]